MWRRATVVFLIAVAIALAVWDIVAFLNGGVDSTVSRTLAAWGERVAIVPLSMGILAGHFFWPWRTDLKGVTIPVMAVLGAVVATADVIIPGWFSIFPGMGGVIFIGSVPLGHFLWPQPRPADE